MSDNSVSKRFACCIEIPVRWGDMDAMGHVNNSVFFTYFEQARVAWLDATGWRADQGDGGPVVASSACTFLRPITYPGTVEVRLLTGPPGRRSIPTFYELRRADDPQTLCAYGEAVMVWIDRKSGRAKELPAIIRQLVEDLPAAD